MEKETGSDSSKSPGDAAAAACLANAGALFGGLHQYDPRLLQATASQMMSGQRGGVAHSPLNAMGLNSASATWWQMASHLAAQDYLARLQASGISFPGMTGGADGVLPPSFPILSQQHTGSSAKSKIPEPPNRESFVLSESVSSSILGGVRLPPDTEIIKYTSSIVGPKIPGTTNRGRKKTISLDPPSVSLLATHASTGLPIEHSPTALLTDRSMMSNGGCSSAQDADAPLNLSMKPNSSSNSSSSVSNSSSPNNNLAPLDFSSHSSSSSSSSRISRRKPGPKPRRLAPPPSSYPIPPTDPSRLSPFYGTDDETTHHKDGRPRNLGRGISKPKKNTVASLLAQSRALGLTGDIDLSKYPSLKANILQQQLEALTERAKTEDRHDKKPLSVPNITTKTSETSHVLNFSTSQRVEGLSHNEESGSAGDKRGSPALESDYEFQNGGGKRRRIDSDLLTPLAKGWRRDTFISGFSPAGELNGDVAYTSPCETTFTRTQELLMYLKERNITDLNASNFSFNPRTLVGDYHQADGSGGFLKLSKQDIKNKMAVLKAVVAKPPIEQRIEAEPVPPKPLQENSAIAMLKNMKLPTPDRKKEMNSIKEAPPSVSVSVSVSVSIPPSPSTTSTTTSTPIAAPIVTPTPASTITTTPLSITMTSSSSSTSPGLTQKETIADKQKKKEKREQQFMEMYIQELNKQREMLYTVELERERRRQHMALVKALEIRKRFEEREKKRLEVQAEKIASREKRIEERRLEIGLLYQIRKPTEDMEITDSKPLPVLERIPGLQLSGQTFGDLLMVHEFLNNFGETLGFDMDSLPTLSSLQLALLGDEEAEEELLSVMTHLIICAIEDPGIPNPARHITILGQSLKQADITHSNISEILRVYLYANATGEIKSLSGACFEREREKRVTDHLNNLCEETNGQKESCISASKNAPFFEALYDNPTFKMSEWLKTKSFVALSPEQKSQILASICHELLQNKAVNKQIDNSMEEVAQHKRDRWATETKIRKLKQFIGRKLRQGTIIPGTGNPLETPGAEAEEEEEDDEAADSDNEINSEGTQPEEDEDRKLSVDELNRKLEKLIRQSEQNVQSLSEAATQLRATCFGEDRYFRRYWTLPAAGGIFVEGMESAEPEILQKMVEEEEQYAKENGTDDLQDTADAATPVPILEKVDDIKDETPEEPMEGNDDNLEPPVLVKEEDVVIKSEDSPQEVPSLTSCTEVENVKSEDVKMEVDEVVTTEVKEEVKEEVVKEEKIEVTEEKEVKTEVKEEKMETDAETKADEEVKAETDNKSDVEKSEDKLETLSNSSQQSSSATDQAQQTTQTPAEPQAEFGWFTIMPKEPCDPCSVTTSSPGLRYGEGGTTELRIPVFPPPASSPGPPDSPTPLMLTPDEAAQLAYMKEHGAPKKSVRKPIPKDYREGWWRISDMKQLAQLVECLHPRGIRERELKRFITWPSLDQTWDTTLKTVLRPNNGLAKLEGDDITVEDDAKRSEEIALRVDLNVLNQVEVLEEKVASSSMQVKGWKCPNRVSGDGRNWAPAYCASDPDLNPVAIAKQKLAALESAIERRYLKPPLGVSTGEVNHLQNLKNEGETLSPTDYDNIPKGLVTWREAIQKAMTAAQVSMCLHMLEASIAWDRSIMKANCQFCHSGDCEDKLLLCDGCDKGYHTYCFKPKMEKIPEGDWYCYECLNKATGERNCIVCGKKFGRNLIFCDQCPRAYHSDCLQPPLVKIPRSKWSCFNCQSKSPKKRSIRKSNPSTTSTPTISNGRPSTEAPSTPKTSTPIGTQTTAVVPETPTEEPPAKKPVEEPAPVVAAPPEEPVVEPTPTPSAEEINKTNKKTAKELAACKQLLEEMEAHDDAWPFLLPVNTKQFPTYKKVIKSPMDLSIIKKRLQDSTYKSKTDFSNDVRLIFNNCETFNEDDSPVGKAGHGMRLFFESRWTDICNSKS